MTDAFRYNTLFAAVLFSILASGITLLFRRRRPALAAIAVLVGVTIVALYLWEASQPQPPEPASSVTSPTGYAPTVSPSSGRGRILLTGPPVVF